MNIVKDITTVVLGFFLYVLFTHPKYFKKKMPKISFGKIQILPSLKIEFENQTIHLHHWIWLTVVLGILNYIAQGLTYLISVKLFLIGGIIQGFTFNDRFRVLIKKQNLKLTNLPPISVVIPAYNEQANIARVLKSLQKQNYGGKFEVIVVDNGSTDKTAQIAKKLGARIIIERQKGVAHARQTGFENAKGEIIASIDADSQAPKDWLNRIAYEFAQKPNVVMVSGMYDFYDSNLLLKFATWFFNYRLFAIFGWYSGTNMAVKKDTFFEIGGFDTTIPVSEDSDLGIRLRKHGKVLRLANFKVKTSARRFNQLGLIGGLWDYSINYIKFKLNIQTEKVSFRAGSEVNEAKLAKVVTYSFGLIIFIFAFLMVPVNPVHAKIETTRKKFNLQVILTVKKGTGIITEEISDASQETQKVTRYLHHHVHR